MGRPDRHFGPRWVLGWQLSDDGGRTWHGYRQLEYGPTGRSGASGYCYASGGWLGDKLHLVYLDLCGTSGFFRPRYQQLSRAWLLGEDE